ncbi:tripartite tricarboxylate transporter substrate binding protein [Variovorax sp. Sphag1AA]|uniref:Bug family tripartite tricarboxylate transporter substrate binding protein n=1 Tax=Variovorax sp. Sphag1AA TaxID=2587027 RepID=UPI00161E7885|nr:tripartite tricarboxylate transporter substrate binding protein [Variovorax sp. Sphag1AA]MBB3177990.1 tripartite-type tricarboxylate transporter receptor subunit TctC [Variovorax sp. Sphag1AA]
MRIKFFPLLLAAMLPLTAAVAQDYPKQPIRFVVPFTPSGGTDIVARLLGQKMSAAMGQPILVENRPGAGSQIGTEYVAASPPDGYTVLLSSSSSLTIPYLRKASFELPRDFTPIGQVGIGTFALVVSPKLPFKTAGEFIAAAKANPGKYSYASAGSGSAGHLALELLRSKTGADLVHVPYKSSGEVANSIISGQVDASIDILTIEKGFIDNGQVRALATTGIARDPTLPQVPTLNETGAVPGGYDLTYWYGLFVPAKTPAPVVKRLQHEFETAMKDPEILARLKTLQIQPSTMTAAQFKENVQTEAAMWKKLIGEKGIRAD